MTTIGIATAVKPEAILARALKAKTPDDIDRIIESCTKSGYKWVPYGGIAGNKAQITLQDDPVRALGERITNGFDAVIERLIAEAGIDASTIMNPVDAVNQLLPSLDDRFNRVAVEVDVSVSNGDARRCTISNLDYGTGIAPQHFPTTILSLSGSNKINKRYCVGTYGQGGAASVGWVGQHGADGYVLIISRISNDAEIGFTIVRYVPPSDSDKRGTYEYLTDMSGNVPVVRDAAAAKGNSPKPPVIPTSFGEFYQGTLVKHFGFDLSAYKSGFSKGTGALTAFNTFLFRPLFPVHLNFGVKAAGRRSPDRKKVTEGGEQVWIKNPRNIRGVGQFLDENTVEVDGKPAKVEYHSPVSRIPIKLSGKPEGYVELSYSVIAKDVNSPLVHQAQTVIGTFNGQTQDERSLDSLSPKFKSVFPQIVSHGKHSLIVELRVDKLTSAALDGLMTSGREHFRDGDVMNQIRKAVTDQILQDEVLLEIENLRFQQSLEGLKRKDTSNAAIKYAVEFVSGLKGTGFTKGGKRRVRAEKRALEPIKLQKDEPTKIEFLVSTATFNLDAETRRRYFIIETNAPNGYRNPRIEFNGEGDRYLTAEIISPLEGGRLRLAVDFSGGQEGMIGIMRAIYNKDIKAEIPYEFVKQEIKRAPKGGTRGSGTQAGFPEPQCWPITPSDPGWNTTWDEKKFAFSVNPVKADGTIPVYYSTVFPQFVSVTDELSEAEADFIESEYVGSLTAHAILLADGWAQYDNTSPVAMIGNRAAASAFLMTAKKALDAKSRKKAK